MYAHDHPPPHAHVRLDDGRGGVVRFDLRTCESLSGFFCTGKALRAWARLRPSVVPFLDELAEAFERLNPRQH